MANYELTKQLPEPFNSALQLSGFSFDYRLAPNKSDHEWLKHHGYITKMGSDCAYYVGDSNGKCIGGLNATSYGDWGTAYNSDAFDKEGFRIFCEMYNDGVVVPWRIRFYHNNICYDYDDHDKTWSMYDFNTKERSECENPIPAILAETKKTV